MNWMKKVCSGSAVAASAAALALLVMAAPEAGAAITTPTSAGATVYNKVTVTYASGSVANLTTSSAVSVTVTTLAARPTITVDSQTASILSGATQLYTYTIRSNSNGTDTYTVTKDVSSSDSSNMLTANTDSIPSTPVTLWGGFAIGAGSDGGGPFITLPGGTAASAVNPLAVNSKLMLTVAGKANQTYNVKSITAGRPQTGTEVDKTEILDKVYLEPVLGADPLTTIVTGTQVGEFKTFTNTVTAGNVNIDPASITISDGTHITNLHVVTAATDINKNPVAYTTNGTDVVTTTILAPKLSILKESRNITANANAAFATSGTTARPGEVVEYRITIKNLHTNSTASIANANVADTLPSYSTYLANSTSISYNGASASPVSDNGSASPLANAGYTLATPLAGNDTAVITFQATVN